ncbi:MAG: GNAT family N-acetyltransferase [Thermomicrobiales bacterium]
MTEPDLTPDPSRRAPVLAQALARIAFRPLADDDPRQMLGWLADPDVSPWYGEGELTLVNLQARYAAIIGGTDTTRGFIIRIDGQDAGYIQCYWLADEPDYARQLALPAPFDTGTTGTDLFIGDPAFRNRGWGTPVLVAFHREIVFGAMDARAAVIAPEPGNLRAVKTYERAGFRWLKTVAVVDENHPENTGDEYVMVQTRAEFLTAFFPGPRD